MLPTKHVEREEVKKMKIDDERINGGKRKLEILTEDLNEVKISKDPSEVSNRVEK